VSRALPAAVAIAAVLAAVVIVANTALTGIRIGELKLGPVIGPAADPNFVPAGAPLGQIGSDPDDPNDPWSAAAPPGGVIVQTPNPSAGPNAVGTLRIPIPKNVPTGPRRVAIQAGHWKSDEAPMSSVASSPRRARSGKVSRRSRSISISPSALA